MRVYPVYLQNVSYIHWSGVDKHDFPSVITHKLITLCGRESPRSVPFV